MSHKTKYEIDIRERLMTYTLYEKLNVAATSICNFDQTTLKKYYIN